MKIFGQFGPPNFANTPYLLPTVLPPMAASELRSRVLALILKTLKRSTRGDYRECSSAAREQAQLQCRSRTVSVAHALLTIP